MYTYILGAFLTRTQPLQNGHIEYVRRILQECSQVVVVIGSANKSGTLRNPYPIEERIIIMQEAIKDEFAPKDASRITVIPLNDLTYANNPDPENSTPWGRYLYDAIVKCTGQKDFTYYSSENQQMLESWFAEVEGNVEIERIYLDNIPHDLSATKVRDALESGDANYIFENCPGAVYRRFELLRKQYLNVLANPNDDFSAQELNRR